MRSWYLTQMTDHEERVFSFEFPAKFLSIDVQDVHKLFIENLSAIFVKFLFYRWRARWTGVFAVSALGFLSPFCFWSIRAWGRNGPIYSKMADELRNVRDCWSLNFREKLKVWALLLQNLPRYFMLRTRRFLVALTKCRDQKSSSLFSSSWYIIRRSVSREDTNMSGKSLPKWIQPEGTGELKLYNSLTREKVRFFYFIYFFLLSFSWCSVVWCNIC